MEESGGDEGFPGSCRNHGPSWPQLVVNLAPTWPMMRPCSPQCLAKNVPKSWHGAPRRAKTPQDTSRRRFSSIFDPSRLRFWRYVHASCYYFATLFKTLDSSPNLPCAFLYCINPSGPLLPQTLECESISMQKSIAVTLVSKLDVRISYYPYITKIDDLLERACAILAMISRFSVPKVSSEI